MRASVALGMLTLMLMPMLMLMPILNVAAAGSATLDGGRLAVFRTAASSTASRGAVVFTGAAVVPRSPLCPAASAVSVAASGYGSGQIALPCARWRPSGRGFIFDDPAATDGVRRIRYAPGRLVIAFGGVGFTAPQAPVTFVEARLAVAGVEHCGRFERFVRMQPGLIRARGPSLDCASTGPTATPTPGTTGVPTGTPIPPDLTGLLPVLLKFAETWDRNWNFEGHEVTEDFTENHGRWDYDDETYEPWLFDRVSVGYHLFEKTNDGRWLDKFRSDFAWYRSHIGPDGIFTPKGFGDTKYGYVRPFVYYERVTGDPQYRPVATRIYDAWQADFTPFTEREMGLALDAAVSYYELTGFPAALDFARRIVADWTARAGSVGAPRWTYDEHEGGGPGGSSVLDLVNSPWMSALYFQAARRYRAVTGDPEVLQQASAYFDFLDANGFYDGSLAHPEFAGLTFPRYLTGSLVGDAGYDESNMGHALDVAGLVYFAAGAKRALGLDSARAETRRAELVVTTQRDFQNWTRTTEWLPKYRLSPPRKFNWMMRGYVELTP